MGVRGLLVGCTVWLGVLVFAAGSASAENVYGDVCGKLGSPAFCAGVFSEPIGVAVDNSAKPTKGDVYLAEYPGKRILRFDKAGGSLGVISLPSSSVPLFDAVDPANGDIYVSDLGTGTVSKLELSGALAAGFGTGGVITVASPTGVGVDPATDHLFVASRNGNVYEFDGTTGTEVGSFPTVGVTQAADGLAVDSAGDVYLVDDNAQVLEYPVAKRGEPVALDANPSGAVAIDPVTKEVYVADNAGLGPEVAVFEGSTGKLLSRFGAGTLGSFGASGAYGLGVSGETHDVYAANRSGGMGVIYEDGEKPESPVTEPASEVKGTTVVLHGKVNPVKAATVEYHFAYNTGSGCEGGPTTPPGTVTEAQGTNVAVSTEATGLSPRTSYSFCLVATNPFGAAFGSLTSFETTASKPVIEVESSSEVTITTARVEATINPSGASTTCEVEYGMKPLNVEAGTIVECPEALGEGITGKNVAVSLASLSEGTVYHYRVIASNAFSPPGGTPGPEQSFQTLIRPGIVEQSALSVSTQAEVLKAIVNTYGVDTTYHFVYGLGEGYGSSFPASDIDLGASSEDLQAHVELSGLQPGTTYHYALVARNAAGTSIGPDQTFTTPPAPLPAVTSTPAVEVSQNGVSLTGIVDPRGVQTFYEFDLGADTSYGTRVFGNAGFATGPVSVNVSFQDLAAGTTYHYRLIASSAYGTTYGPDQTFTTPAYPTATLTAPVAPVLIAVPMAVFPSNEPVASSAKARQATRSKLKARAKKKRKGRITRKERRRRPSAVKAHAASQSVRDLPASNVTQFTATLNATINPGLIPASYHFVYGTTNAYGSVAPVPDLYAPPGDTEEKISQVISGLEPGTTYHYALVAADVVGAFTGADQTFTTPGVPPPLASTGTSSEISRSSAVLSGTVDPMGWDTTYRFEYGTSSAYGSSWPTVDVDMGTLIGGQPVLIAIQNLQPGTTYHYRLVATNPGGVSYGADQAFTTSEYPVSVIQANPVGSPLGITPAKASKPKPKIKTHKRKKPSKRSKPKKK